MWIFPSPFWWCERWNTFFLFDWMCNMVQNDDTSNYTVGVSIYWSKLHLFFPWQTTYIHTTLYYTRCSISFNKFYRETSWKSFPHFGSSCNITQSLYYTYCGHVLALPQISPFISYTQYKCLMLLHIVQKVLGCDDVVKLILVEVYAKK